jgi:arginine-tRNA-protein transferase
MIYSFYDPEHEARAGLGNYIILDHIRRAVQAELPYVYLGYWVEGSARMQYKVRYRPLERLGPSGWQRFTEAEQSALISSTAVARRDDVLVVDGGSKDGTPGGQKQYKLA